MGLRDKLKKLERTARENLVSFELLDGGRYYHDPTRGTLFLHSCNCGRAGNPDKWPEPPEVLHKVAQAKDPQAALEAIGGTVYSDIFPYDPEALARDREIKPRSLVAGRDVYDQAVEDLSEP
jgi:hypothetical protein